MHILGLALNTSSLTARRDSFDRNTSAFSPSLDFNSTSVAAVNGNGTASRKWPVNSYSGMPSISPLAPGTPPPTGKFKKKNLTSHSMFSFFPFDKIKPLINLSQMKKKTIQV